MSSPLDLNVLPLVRHAGQDQFDHPGLQIAEPPRRPARGRSTDHLILYLSMEGNAPLSPGKQDQILVRLAKTYFDTPGSITAALRTIAETLNHFLLDRNVRNASTGRQEVAMLSLVVLRGEQLFLAQSGPMHAFVLSAGEPQHLYDPQIAGRGLGLSRMTPIRYAQFDLQPNDTLILAAQPPSTWSASALADIRGQGPESLRRRLLSRATTDLDAVLIQAKPGVGKLQLLKTKPASQATVEGADRMEVPVPPGEKLSPSPEPVRPTTEQPVHSPAPVLPSVQEDQQAAPNTPPQTTNEVKLVETMKGPTPQPETPAAQLITVEPGSSQPFPAGAGTSVLNSSTTPSKPVRQPSQAALPKLSLSPLWNGLSALVRPVGKGAGRVARGGSVLLGRMLPGEALFTIPAATMAFIAIAVPLVVVAIASLVYFQRGRAAQYQALYQLAEQSANQARSQSDPEAARSAWRVVIGYLDRAEDYRITSAAEELRLQAQGVLDQLDLVKRTKFEPAVIGGLPETVRIIQMLVASSDLFLLDSNSGSVFHALDTSNRGYELDQTFQCGPGSSGVTIVDRLIDMVAPPPGSPPDTALLAMDAKGNLLYCFLGKAPVGASLAHPATAANWGDLVGFTLDTDLGNLYVLDPADQAVWAYWNGKITEEPQLFFTEEVPPLKDVIDLAVNHSELYLLHADGHVTLCSFGNLGVAPTRCNDPLPFVDFRAGRENSPLVLENPFSQILFVPPPGPSLYFLEPASRSIYRFSLNSLGYLNQYSPATVLAPGAATAFAVDNINHTLFLAIGNQVYYGSIP